MTESWHGQRVPTCPVDECSVRSDWNLAHQPKAAQARSVPSTVALTKQPGVRHALLRVEDDDPEGFSSLTDSFTLFADSSKKGNVQQRGRFNLGEKLVIAMCCKAEILHRQGPRHGD